MKISKWGLDGMIASAVNRFVSCKHKHFKGTWDGGNNWDKGQPSTNVKDHLKHWFRQQLLPVLVSVWSILTFCFNSADCALVIKLFQNLILVGTGAKLNLSLTHGSPQWSMAGILFLSYSDRKMCVKQPKGMRIPQPWSESVIFLLLGRNEAHP